MIYASCDTFIAQATDGTQLFAKNSDRDPNEAHQIIYVDRQDFKEPSDVNCTYISIPQVKYTNAVLLCKPVWIWGAEMGVNEHGVVIGNEALFSKFAANKVPSLIGMDFVRLGLERGNTARAALDVITQLLERHGQGGNCGFDHKVYYHNAFMIVDRHEAWVLETIHKHWIVRRASRSCDSISNYPSITTQWDMICDSLKDIVNAEEERGKQFDFSKYCANVMYSYFGEGQKRMCRTRGCLAKCDSIDVGTMISLCQDHGPSFLDERRISTGLTGQSVCMHAGFGPIRCNQTTGSMIVQLRDDGFTTWVTGTSAPCLSVFKPLLHISHLPQVICHVDPKTADDSLWWRHERLHRLVLQDYPARAPKVREALKLLQHELITQEPVFRHQENAKQQEWAQNCFARSMAADHNLADEFHRHPTKTGNLISLPYNIAWSWLNRRVKIKVASATNTSQILVVVAVVAFGMALFVIKSRR